MCEMKMKQDVVEIIDQLCEKSKTMSGHIQDFLEQMEEMVEDIEDLAVNKAQETQGVSIVNEMKSKMESCRSEMAVMEAIGMTTPMGATAKTIKDLETHSLEMFTRLAMLESLHIIPGLESTKNKQLTYWGEWQEAAAKLKKIMEGHV